jgi:hypothetical protein
MSAQCVDRFSRIFVMRRSASWLNRGLVKMCTICLNALRKLPVFNRNSALARDAKGRRRFQISRTLNARCGGIPLTKSAREGFRLVKSRSLSQTSPTGESPMPAAHRPQFQACNRTGCSRGSRTRAHHFESSERPGGTIGPLTGVRLTTS